MKFSQYHFTDVVIKNIDNLGFKRPTDIQYKAITPILNGEDVLAVAQTGTGKTAAFAIPIVHNLTVKRAENHSFSPRCLVMVPTHELAMQVADVFKALMNGTKLKALALFGGVQQSVQIDILKQGVDVLVATPGRMFRMSKFLCSTRLIICSSWVF